MKRIILFLLGFVQLPVYAQITSALPASVSVASTSVSDSKNWTPFHNPAPLSTNIVPQLNILFESRYIITTLATKCFSFTWPANHFVTAFSVVHHGFSMYHEMLIGLTFARNFSDRFSFGLQFNYHTVYFASSNRYYAAIYPQIGLSVPFNDTFRFGFHVYNPFGSHIEGESQTKYLPAIFSLGCAYDFTPEFCWRFQTDKEMSSNYRFATAFDYRINNQTRFQLGVYVHEYLVPCMGFGYGFSSFSFDLSVELHPLLGLNTIAQLQYRFNR